MVAWLKARLPHVENCRNIWGGSGKRIFRIYGLKPHYRLCLLDYTRSNNSAGGAGRDSIRLSLFGRPVFYRPGTRA